MLSSLCQSNFLSQRCNSWLQMVNQWEHVWNRLIFYSYLCFAVTALWCEVEMNISTSRVVSLPLESFPSFRVEAQFYSHLSPFSGLPLTFSLLVFHSHLLSVIIQHTRLWVNWAILNIFPSIWQAPHSWTPLSSSPTLLLLAAAPLCFAAVRYPAHTCQAWIILKRGQENTPSVGCLAVGRDKPGTCHRDKVVFTQQGNQWGWSASKYPAAASWLIFISGHNLCVLTPPAAVKCSSTDDSH